ncbi:kinase-like domain-containing protein [Trichophaea hybrida]|nr:kinase-like domain-containing protein [Trichophaea hybrida]
MDFQILEKMEVFAPKNDDFEYSHTKVIFTDGHKFFYTYTQLSLDELDEDSPHLPELQNMAATIPADVWPICPMGSILAPKPIPSDCYVKRPSLLDFGDGQSDSKTISELILHEVRICEILRHHQHPNVAKYLGCIVDNDRIVGLCLPKYSKTLLQLVQEGVHIDIDSCLDGIKRGIDHLHGLGYIHNDINSNNIMFDAGDDTPIIIDFDSCQLEGDILGIKSGTFMWCDESSVVAVRQNDYYGLLRIRNFLEDMGGNRGGDLGIFHQEGVEVR